MAKLTFACIVLLALLPGCGGGNDSADNDVRNAGNACFTVTADATAIAAGAIGGKQTQCVGSSEAGQACLTNGSCVTLTDVTISGEGNQRPSPGWATTVTLDLTYLGSDIVPATFSGSDACSRGAPWPNVTLSYASYDPTDGLSAEWACKTCMTPSATFEMSITSVVAPQSSISETPIHGTLHAVCEGNSSPPTGKKAGAGAVTIEGPF